MGEPQPNMGETRPYLGETRQYGRDDWVRLANYGRDSPTMGETRQLWARLAIIGEATHQLPNVTR